MIQNIPTGWHPAAFQAARPQRMQGSPDGTTSMVAGSTSRDVDASLNITTKEGDTFSITASFDTTATYAGVRGRGERGSAWNFSTSSQVSMQVEGSLNEQELEDISRIVKTFLHDLRAMLRGRDVSIENVAEGDAKSLESVSATADTRTTVTLVAADIKGPPRRVPGGPLPRLEPEEGFHRHDHGRLDRAALGQLLPQPTPSPFTPEIAVAAPIA